MKKVSDYIIEFISRLGVKHVFILAGGQAMHLVDSLGRHPHVEHICALHEQAAAMMAEAYSRTTENFGAAIVTTGPGGTNAITGVASAWLDSTPCMFISGQFRTENIIGKQKIRQTCLQGTNIVDIVKPITKYATMITEPKRVKYELEKATFLAKNGRPGPVWLDVPLDIQAALVDESDLASFNPELSTIKYDGQLLIGKVKKCIAWLSKAERPVILAGHGIRLSKSVNEFLEIVEKLGIPVMTSINGIDLVHEEHPLFMGRPNYWGQRYANFIVQNSDVLLSVGSGLHLELTGFNYKAFARESKKIVVDIDPWELKKVTIKPDLAINYDVSVFLKELNRQIKGFKNNNVSKWVDICRQWKEEYPIILQSYLEEKKNVNPFVFINVLSDELNGEDIIIPGSAGTHFTTAVQAFKVKKGQRVFSEIGIGAMGHSLPSSIAAAIASGGKRTICLTGDGGIQLNIQELQTVQSYNLPIKIFVMNNGGYISIKNTQKNYFDGNFVGCNVASGLKLPNLEKLAKTYGFRTFKIINHKELRNKIRKVLATEGPVFCEVMLSPDAVLQPKLTSQKLPTGNMISSPLEDLWPFLDREDFLKHLFIKQML